MLTLGVTKELGLYGDSISEICQEYAKRRKIAKKIKLNWRSQKRSLLDSIHRAKNPSWTRLFEIHKKLRFRYWDSRPIEGIVKRVVLLKMRLDTGTSTSIARFKTLVFRMVAPKIGIDLGLKNQMTCSDMTEPYSRENLTRQHADALAMAQRANKKRRVTKIHAKMANRRRDWAHKKTSKIVNPLVDRCW